MIDAVEACVFEHAGLALGKKADGAADGAAPALEAPDAVSQALDFLVREAHAGEPDAVAGHVVTRHELVIGLELLVGYPAVGLDVCLRALGLGAVGTILRAVAAAGVGEQLDAYHEALVSSPELEGLIEELCGRGSRCLEEGDGLLAGEWGCSGSCGYVLFGLG